MKELNFTTKDVVLYKPWRKEREEKRKAEKEARNYPVLGKYMYRPKKK